MTTPAAEDFLCSSVDRETEGTSKPSTSTTSAFEPSPLQRAKPLQVMGLTEEQKDGEQKQPESYRQRLISQKQRKFRDRKWKWKRVLRAKRQTNYRELFSYLWDAVGLFSFGCWGPERPFADTSTSLRTIPEEEEEDDDDKEKVPVKSATPPTSSDEDTDEEEAHIRDFDKLMEAERAANNSEGPSTPGSPCASGPLTGEEQDDGWEVIIPDDVKDDDDTASEYSQTSEYENRNEKRNNNDDGDWPLAVIADEDIPPRVSLGLVFSEALNQEQDLGRVQQLDSSRLEHGGVNDEQQRQQENREENDPFNPADARLSSTTTIGCGEQESIRMSNLVLSYGDSRRSSSMGPQTPSSQNVPLGTAATPHHNLSRSATLNEPFKAPTTAISRSPFSSSVETSRSVSSPAPSVRPGVPPFFLLSTARAFYTRWKSCDRRVANPAEGAPEKQELVTVRYENTTVFCHKETLDMLEGRIPASKFNRADFKKWKEQNKKLALTIKGGRGR